MLQRIQSVFLALAASCSFATWLFPVRTWIIEESSTTFLTRGLFNSEGVELIDVGSRVPFHIIHSLVGAVLLVCIFLHRNRMRQARVIRGAWLMMLLAGVLQFITGNSLNAYLGHGADGSYGVSFFLPFAAVLFAILAERAIKKDEALVKSADRLR